MQPTSVCEKCGQPTRFPWGPDLACACPKKDMYGHEIVPIGNDLGVSTAFAHHLDGDVTPLFSFFHSSDGFRQSLFSIGGREESPHRPQVTDIFDDRLREVMAMLQDGGKP